MNKYIEVNISELIGKTIAAIEVNNPPNEVEHSIRFITNDGTFTMSHKRDCCEEVWIEDIAGDLNDLIGCPILKASVESNEQKNPDKSEWDRSYMQWTFYKLATIKGYVDIRWIGKSNGYYSMEVDFQKLVEDKNKQIS